MSHLNNIYSSQQTLPRLFVEISEMTIYLYGLGVIQQLRGPNITLLDLQSTPLDWKIMNILHTTYLYSVHVTKHKISNDHLPTSLSHVVIE